MAGQPDLIVAIDYGMTCTGVAYANLTRGKNVLCIQRWPGRSHANENKVPTVVVYNKGSSAISSWGFQSETRFEQNNPSNREYCQWFKTFLDPTVLRDAQERDPASAPKSQGDVDRWTEDYLRLLYGHISTKLASELPPNKPWASAKVEFIFSVPTTWAPHATVEKFKNIALDAGFGSHRNHSIEVGLTEAEAAAVHAAVESSVIFAENEVLLVCDAGGGTTDLSVLEVEGLTRNIPELRQLDVVNGRNIGSTQIDHAFEDMALARLQQANSRRSMGIDLEDAAWAMMKSAQYQDAKCDYGSSEESDLRDNRRDKFRVNIPELDYRYSNPEFGIQDGQMSFTMGDLKGLFDMQIKRLLELIDTQFQSFQRSNQGKQIAHLVLSGGLGSSAYVQRCLKERYAMNVNTFACARQLKVHTSSQPQLAVCKGICLDRVKKMEGDGGILRYRCCRASYGIYCRTLYDKKNPDHHGLTSQRDPLDGKYWIEDTISWFIKKGETIDTNKPVVKDFTRKIRKGDPRDAFDDQVIVSDLEKDFLPLLFDHNTRKLCKVTADLSGADDAKFKKKNSHWWQSKEAYVRVTYEIRVVIGPADIRFELWFDDHKLSDDYPIAVEWQAAPVPEHRSSAGAAERRGTTKGHRFNGRINGQH